MIYFIDIDGTLTDDPGHADGNPIHRRIEAVRALCDTHEVHLWSARGANYAWRFAVEHDLPVESCQPKPDIVIDDNPKIRPGWRVEPPEFLE